jgi:DNA-binding FadR family transcriptional regulator
MAVVLGIVRRSLPRPAIAGLAAGRATREKIAEVERILEEQHKEVLQGRTGVVQDTAVPSAITHSAHNRAITRIVSALMDLLAQSHEEALHTPGRPAPSHADHRRILKAIQRRDEGPPTARCWTT